MNGFVQIPRSISALRPSLRTLLTYICHEVRFSTPLETDFGTVGIGEMITSRSALMRATGLTAQKVRTALTQLVDGGYIEVEATARFSKIALLWPDFIMLNNQANNQANNQVATSASVEDSVSYSGQKNEITKSITKSITNYNNKDINKDYNNTHTSNIYPVNTKNAPARESAPAPAYTQADDTRVAELYEWMTKWTPELLAMRRTFQPTEVKEMVDNYPTEVLHTILGQMWSKRVYIAEDWAKKVFDKYAKSAQKAVEVKADDHEELLTYEKMRDEVYRYGLKQLQHFEMVPQPQGKPLWRRIN